jgi:hypothetical protein
MSESHQNGKGSKTRTYFSDSGRDNYDNIFRKKKAEKKTPKKEYCINCEYHRIINDRDPDDWFNNDDVALVCTKLENTNKILKSKYESDRNEFEVISGSRRPYEVKKVGTPVWCPLKA